MSVYRIEKGIPLPASRIKYPLRAMKVGDSFFMPAATGKNSPHSVRVSAEYVRKSISGFRVSVRRTARGHRVWRVA